MRKTWQRMDLGGAGLQSANLRLAATLKRRRVAFGLLPLFGLGLHRSYLEDARGAWAYRLATLAVLGLAIAGSATIAGAVALAAAAMAVYDIGWIDRRIVALNKQIRISTWLGHGGLPAPGHRGRFADDETADDPHCGEAGPTSERSRVPTLAEQERLLAQLGRKHRVPRD